MSEKYFFVRWTGDVKRVGGYRKIIHSKRNDYYPSKEQFGSNISYYTIWCEENGPKNNKEYEKFEV